MEETEEILKDPLENLDDVETTKETTPEEKTTPEDNSTSDKEPKEPEEEKKPTPKEIRHAQQQEGSLKEVERLRNLVIDAEVDKAKSDASSLLELNKKDAKLAKETAARFNRKDTEWGTYENFLSNEGKTPTEEEKKTYTKAEMLEFYQEQKAKDEHDAALVEVEELINELPTDVQEQAKADFDELSEGKLLTRSKALKIAKLVTLSLTKDVKEVKEVKEEKKVDATGVLRKLSSTGLNQQKKVSTGEKVLVIDANGNEIFLNSNELN